MILNQTMNNRNTRTFLTEQRELSLDKPIFKNVFTSQFQFQFQHWHFSVNIKVDKTTYFVNRCNATTDKCFFSLTLDKSMIFHQLTSYENRQSSHTPIQMGPVTAAAAGPLSIIVSFFKLKSYLVDYHRRVGWLSIVDVLKCGWTWGESTTKTHSQLCK